MAERMSCPDPDTLVELALGELAGRDRADAVAHLEGCEACRAEVAELSATVEAVLATAPAAEPPLGFEQAVLDRVIPTRSSRSWRRVLAVAAAVALVAGLAAMVGWRLGRSPGRGPEVAEAAMVTPSGRTVGAVWRYEGDPGWVFVSVPGWTAWESAGGGGGDGTGHGTPGGHAYRLVAQLADGTEADLGPISFEAGGSWGTSTTVPTAQLHRVAITDETGRTWCEGEF